MGRLGVAFVALPAGGRKALSNSDRMPWFAGVCGLVPTTRRVCGLARLAVAFVRFFVAAGSALAGALTFGSARGSGFLAGTATVAGEAGAGVSALGSVRATSGPLGFSAVAGLSSGLFASVARARREPPQAGRRAPRRLAKRRMRSAPRWPRRSHHGPHRRGSSIPPAEAMALPPLRVQAAEPSTSAGADDSGEDLLRRVVRCLFDRACFQLGGFHRPIRSLGGSQLHRARMRDGGRGSAIRFDRFGCGLDIGR